MARRKTQNTKTKAKGRRNYLVSLKNPRKPDIKVCTSLAICGHVHYEQIKGIWTDKRIRRFEEEGLIEKVEHVTKKETIVAYKLTESGARYVRKYIYDEAIYKSKSIKHDLGMADKYFSLSDDEQKTVRTESELRKELDTMYARSEITKEEYENASCVDFSYVSDSTGIEVGFEVITSNYTKEEITAKETYCSIVSMTFEGVRV